MWHLTMNEKVIEREERSNNNLEQKSHADDVLNDTQKLAVIDTFLIKKNGGTNKSVNTVTIFLEIIIGI